MNEKNLLLEIGTEELPPKSLRNLAQSLHDNFVNQLKNNNLKFKNSKWFATPRRLAVFIESLNEKQDDQEIEIKGPTLKAAYDENNNPTKAALGWAQANNINLKDAKTLKTDKGEWLYIKTVKNGSQTTELIPELFKQSLKNLPIPRLMHWGDKKEEFVRPVHTLCIIFGDQLIDATILGLKSSKIVKCHRFLGPKEIEIPSADAYVETLKNVGHVIVDYDERKSSIISQVKKIAESINGNADLDDNLVEEVTSIVEEPHIYKATFEEKFLDVPSEALVYTMKGDQKYFPIYDQNGRLMSSFAFVSNICPDDPTSLISGNERVVRPRLSDAEFFFQTDRKQTLESFFPRLENIIYQKDIGSIAYRSNCVEQLTIFIAREINADEIKAARAAHLAKCDLASTMVNEFTDTQGVMGMHYAELDGEDKEVSSAIFEQYLPRFSGDIIPTKPVQMSLSIADKIITLVGIFGINQLPKGDKDPFGLRRAAIGLLRIIIENKLSINLYKILDKACSILNEKLKSSDTKENVINFIYNRLKAFYQEQGIDTSIFLSVLSNKPQDLLDFDKRVYAVKTFKELPESENLASAYKRINNILSKTVQKKYIVDENFLVEKEETELYRLLKDLSIKVDELYKIGDYKSALNELSKLRTPVDNFFENVMVNAEDQKIKENRLGILQKLHEIISKTADISVLY
jgi:glycyl-tRNA synthetase beta chain